MIHIRVLLVAPGHAPWRVNRRLFIVMTRHQVTSKVGLKRLSNRREGRSTLLIVKHCMGEIRAVKSVTNNFQIKNGFQYGIL